MSETVVPFVDESVKALENAMNLADIHKHSRDPDSISFDLIVGSFNSVKVEIFANEHPPPHFRVKVNEYAGNFSIDTCEFLNGDASIRRRHREIRKWHAENRKRLIETWNETRPGNCPVGAFREQ